MLNNQKKQQAMQEAIDIAWNNPEGAVLRALMFPDGKPSPEEFVSTVSAFVKSKLNL